MRARPGRPSRAASVVMSAVFALAVRQSHALDFTEVSSVMTPDGRPGCEGSAVFSLELLAQLDGQLAAAGAAAPDRVAAQACMMSLEEESSTYLSQLVGAWTSKTLSQLAESGAARGVAAREIVDWAAGADWPAVMAVLLPSTLVDCAQVPILLQAASSQPTSSIETDVPTVMAAMLYSKLLTSAVSGAAVSAWAAPPPDENSITPDPAPRLLQTIAFDQTRGQGPNGRHLRQAPASLSYLPDETAGCEGGWILQKKPSDSLEIVPPSVGADADAPDLSALAETTGPVLPVSSGQPEGHGGGPEAESSLPAMDSSSLNGQIIVLTGILIFTMVVVGAATTGVLYLIRLKGARVFSPQRNRPAPVALSPENALQAAPAAQLNLAVVRSGQRQAPRLFYPSQPSIPEEGPIV